MLSQLLTRALSENRSYQVAHHVANQNATGNMWLVGGKVYRTLAHLLYGGDTQEHDFDFIVDELIEEVVPPDWIVVRNRFGNPKFVGPGVSVDIVPLSDVESIKERDLPASIDHFLSGNPLTVQSIAYGCQAHELIGEVGLQAIRNQTVGPNYLPGLRRLAKHRGVSINDVIRQKAVDIGFNPVLWDYKQP